MNETLLTQLEQLAALQRLQVAPDLEDVASTLHESLGSYAELELRSDGTRIDLVTLNRQAEAAGAFLDLLVRRGSSAEEMSRAAALVRFGHGHTIGMKLPIAAPPGHVWGSAGGEVYVRGAIPLAEAAWFIERHGGGHENTRCIERLAQEFGKSLLHMLAVDAGPRSEISAFLTTYLQPGGEAKDRALLAAVLSHCGVAPEAIHSVLALHRLLSAARPETLYFSWKALDSARGAKIDYAGARLGIVAEAFAALVGADDARIVSQWGRILDARQASYVGVAVGPTGPTGLRVYFTK